MPVHRGLAAVRTYIESLPAGARRELKKMRAAIRSVAPGAVEVMAYRIPAFTLHGRALVYYAAWKNHTSLYPITPRITRAHAAAVKGYETGKGTIRFPLDKPLPVALVKRLVKTRMAEVGKNARG
jgi:uncharacterized protein YdhG (YjbR/CyaY superfamily)